MLQLGIRVRFWVRVRVRCRIRVREESIVGKADSAERNSKTLNPGLNPMPIHASLT